MNTSRIACSFEGFLSVLLFSVVFMNARKPSNRSVLEFLKSTASKKSGMCVIMLCKYKFMIFVSSDFRLVVADGAGARAADEEDRD